MSQLIDLDHLSLSLGRHRVRRPQNVTRTVSTESEAGNYRVLGLSVRFTVANKGAIDLTTAPSPDCMPEQQSVMLNFPSATITGGSRGYEGASGSGTLRKTLSPGSIGAFGKDTWDMTLLVPGLAFDTTPPVLRGAVTKTVVAAQGVTWYGLPTGLPPSTRRTARCRSHACHAQEAAASLAAPSSTARPSTTAGTPDVHVSRSLSKRGDSPNASLSPSLGVADPKTATTVEGTGRSRSRRWGRRRSLRSSGTRSTRCSRSRSPTFSTASPIRDSTQAL
jgi:hypothetical protein